MRETIKSEKYPWSLIKLLVFDGNISPRKYMVDELEFILWWPRKYVLNWFPMSIQMYGMGNSKITRQNSTRTIHDVLMRNRKADSRRLQNWHMLLILWYKCNFFPLFVCFYESFWIFMKVNWRYLRCGCTLMCMFWNSSVYWNDGHAHRKYACILIGPTEHFC